MVKTATKLNVSWEDAQEGINQHGTEEASVWSVVQKQRRPRKQDNKVVGSSQQGTGPNTTLTKPIQPSGGSRFDILQEGNLQDQQNQHLNSAVTTIPNNNLSEILTKGAHDKFQNRKKDQATKNNSTPRDQPGINVKFKVRPPAGNTSKHSIARLQRDIQEHTKD